MSIKQVSKSEFRFELKNGIRTAKIRWEGVSKLGSRATKSSSSHSDKARREGNELERWNSLEEDSRQVGRGNVITGLAVKINIFKKLF